MGSTAPHTRGSVRGHEDREQRDPGNALGALRLGRPERWVLGQVRRRGVSGFVVQMTLVAVVSSVVLVTAMMLALYGPDDPTLLPGVVMAALVPALVAPPVLLFSVRLAAALDRASHLLWDAAHTDPLTDVANRRAFFDAMDRRDRSDGPLDVAIVDVDEFKALNDHHGHAGGDRALQHVASSLVELAGPSGLVARMGGDEFAVVVPVGADEERPSTATFDHDGMRYSVTFGWERCEPGESVDAALRVADRELYDRKPSGSGHCASTAR